MEAVKRKMAVVAACHVVRRFASRRWQSKSDGGICVVVAVDSRPCWWPFFVFGSRVGLRCVFVLLALPWLVRFTVYLPPRLLACLSCTDVPLCLGALAIAVRYRNIGMHATDRNIRAEGK